MNRFILKSKVIVAIIIIIITISILLSYSMSFVANEPLKTNVKYKLKCKTISDKMKQCENKEVVCYIGLRDSSMKCFPIGIL